MIRPLHDQLIVRRDPSACKTDSGKLFLPENEHGNVRAVTGVVVAVSETATGEDNNPRSLSVAVGDHVMFKRHAGHEVTVNGDILLLMREGDLMARLP